MKLIQFSILAIPLMGFSCFGIGERVKEKVAEEATEQLLESAVPGDEAEIELGNDSIAIEGEGGERLDIGTGKLPEDIPSDVPIYTRGKVESSLVSRDPEQGQSWTISWTTEDPVEQVNGFYESALSEDGWNITYQYQLDSSYGYTAEKGLLSVTVTISETDGTTNIFLIVTQSVESESE